MPISTHLSHGHLKFYVLLNLLHLSGWQLVHSSCFDLKKQQTDTNLDSFLSHSLSLTTLNALRNLCLYLQNISRI